MIPKCKLTPKRLELWNLSIVYYFSDFRIANRRNFLSGTFAIKGMKALNSERDCVLRGALASKENGSGMVYPLITLSQRKKSKKVARNRRVNDLEEEHKMEERTAKLEQLSPEAMASLKKFCWRLIIEGRFNRLVRITKEIVCSCSFLK